MDPRELRLSRIEKQVHRWRTACVGLLGVVLAGGLVAAQRVPPPPQQPQDLVARSLRLVNPDGKVVFTLLSGNGKDETPLLRLNTPDGVPIFQVGSVLDQAVLSLHRPDGKPGFSGFMSKTGPEMSLYHGDEKRSAVVWTENDEGRITLFDDQGKAVWVAPPKR